MAKKGEILVEVNNLKMYFEKKSGFFRPKVDYIKAVDDVSFYIKKGETLGLVGESGCGKTTTGRSIIRVYDPTSGSIKFDGVEVANMSQEEFLPFRKKMQMIFQDPYASLDSRMTVFDIVGESLDIHNICQGKEKQEKINNLLEVVGLSQDHASRYPHEFSGGQRQRIGIARALAIDPEFIICDEPISALDVSIQAQIVNMLEDLQESRELTYLFIAHDLSMVRHISDRVGVMYLGALMEIGPTDEIYEHNVHPYTRALLSAVPIPDPRNDMQSKQILLEGDVPSPINAPPGCKFATRCRYAKPECKQDTPKLKQIGKDHFAACHLL